MSNWKKDGYKIGDEVFVVKVLGMSNDVTSMTGTVTYVGTKKLKVEIKQKYKNSILEFDYKGIARGSSFGFYYYVYKSKEAYLNETKKDDYINELRNSLSKKINSLSLEQLEELESILDKQFC